MHLCCADYFNRSDLLGAEAAPLVPIDPDILRLMENESLLIDKECLTLGEEIGKGWCRCHQLGWGGCVVKFATEVAGCCGC